MINLLKEAEKKAFLKARKNTRSVRSKRVIKFSRFLDRE